MNETHQRHPFRGRPTSHRYGGYAHTGPRRSCSQDRTLLVVVGGRLRVTHVAAQGGDMHDRKEPDRVTDCRGIAPFARRGAEPVPEDPAEVGEIVKAPKPMRCRRRAAPCGGIRPVERFSTLQTLHLDVHCGTKFVRRPSSRWHSAAKFRTAAAARGIDGSDQ